MKLQILALAAAALTIGGCATTDGGGGYGSGYGRDPYKSACQRDYENNRAAATAFGAIAGALAGAAIAKNDAAGAAIGGVAGGVAGNQLSKKDDPCGYGFGGYDRDGRYGRYDDRDYRQR